MVENEVMMKMGNVKPCWYECIGGNGGKKEVVNGGKLCKCQVEELKFELLFLL